MSSEDRRKLVALSALEQADCVARRKIKASELFEAHVEVIERRESELNAFASLTLRQARRAARRLDEGRRRWPKQLPLFWGVPFGIKDTDAVRGTFTKAGSRAFRWVLTPYDSPAMRAFRPGGFISLGKTTTSEFALLPIVEPDIHPPTRNPIDPQFSAGGSSGGAAAAVASGMLSVAHAADGGGSIRIPASFCGLFGFKSSRGLTPHFYEQFETVRISTAGCVSHTVADSAAISDLLAGRPVMRPGSLLDRLEAAPSRVLRVRVCWESELATASDEVVEAVQRVAAIIEALGHEVEEGPGLKASVDEFLPVYGRLAANPPVLRESQLQPVTRWLREIGRDVRHDEAQCITDELARRVMDWFGDADIWVLPTTPGTAPRVGEWSHLDAEAHFRAAALLGAFTAPFNVSGQPAANVPAGLSKSGLPLGVQIAGRLGEDLVVLQLARELERAMPWRTASH